MTFARDTDGIFRFLTPARASAALPFLRQYRDVRARDGHGRQAPEYYRALPVVRRDDPCAAEWRIRRESYELFQEHALPAIWEGPIRIVDLGAGSGWLSHRLASFGHQVVAVDFLDDEDGGLAACRHYPVPLVAVQADMDALPFAAGQFDLAVCNASLHYSSDPVRTLAEAKRLLTAAGTLVVMDSPMFSSEAAGQAMLDAQRTSWSTSHGAVPVIQPGVGFLTFALLDTAAQTLGMRGRFVPSRGPMSWRVRREIGRARLQRQPASFGVWIAR
jgi:SAM-dependent methyltransferase